MFFVAQLHLNLESYGKEQSQSQSTKLDALTTIKFFQFFVLKFV